MEEDALLARLSLLPVVEPPSVDLQMSASFEPEMVSSFRLDEDSLCCDWSLGLNDLAGESDPSAPPSDPARFIMALL